MSTHITSANAIGVEGTRQGLSIENRQKLSDLAAEFESMLLNHLLRDMNEAGKWSSLGEEGDTLGAGTFEQTFQQEFAGYLAKAGGMGLSQQLLKALDDVMGKTGDVTNAPAAAPSPIAVPAATAELKLPVSTVTSAYGWRQDPFTGEAKFHKGVDFRAAEGSDVQSAGAGRVTFAGNLPGYGTTVVVEHANGLSTRYAHLSELLVKAGDQVADRQSIGRAGQSGKATAAHLHFEVLEDGVPVDPFR